MLRPSPLYSPLRQLSCAWHIMTKHAHPPPPHLILLANAKPTFKMDCVNLHNVAKVRQHICALSVVKVLKDLFNLKNTTTLIYFQ